MKLDRLLAITMTLLNQPRVNATELAERFEVSLRTIYRDMESINQAGIPVVSFPGSDGGYEIMPSYRIDKQMLSLDDFAAIYSALRGARSATNNSDLDGLMEKLGALMTHPTGVTGAEAAVDLDFTPSPNDRDKIAPLGRAIKDLNLVRLEYLDGKGLETERTVEPMGLFLKGYVWYLYGYCLTRSDIRVFRLSRILETTILPDKFERREYSLRDVERQFMQRVDFQKVRAVLCFSPELKTRVRDEFGFGEITANPDGTLTVIAHYSSEEQAIRQILKYSYHATLIDPPELVEQLKRHIAAMAAKYEIKPFN
ncbi:helix-turn-helix transcriptional regulator [Fontibacillus sp. BL9]|uniref:helix-turn-helix transcriptional regulator n=1 Tax=Fontibacillus sp. BL9 TaxID=3389971 RepID=UPI00397AC819